MDPFSIATAVIGLSGPALSSISSLQKVINDLGEVQEEVKDIQTHLEGIQTPLHALQGIPTVDHEAEELYKSAIAKTGMANAVNECGKACQSFEEKLVKWTRRSTKEKMSLRDRMNVGLWRKEEIRTFKTRLETCERTVHFAVSSTQLILQSNTLRRESSSDDSLIPQMRALELQATSQMEVFQRQRAETEQRVIRAAGQSDSDDEESAQIAKAEDEIREQSRLLDEMQVSLGIVFAQLRASRTHQDIGDVITDGASMAMVGLPERLVGRIDQRIGNVATTNKSVSMVGIFDQGVDLNEYFRRS